MGIELLPQKIIENYEVHEWKHACAVLNTDFKDQWNDIIAVLSTFRLRREWIVEAGGRKSKVASWIDGELASRGWEEKQFVTQVKVDAEVADSPTHKIDCYKNRVALEIEWNNKDPFFDRDLNNFRLLFDLRAISVGIIITRSDELQEIFNSLGRKESFGASTTHMSKLLPRINGGSGGAARSLCSELLRSSMTR